MAAKDERKCYLNIHSDVDTATYGPWSESRCRMEANSILQTGFWVGDKLYPASRVVYIELKEVK